jgi:hypothetical protein
MVNTTPGETTVICTSKNNKPGRWSIVKNDLRTENSLILFDSVYFIMYPAYVLRSAPEGAPYCLLCVVGRCRLWACGGPPPHPIALMDPSSGGGSRAIRGGGDNDDGGGGADDDEGAVLEGRVVVRIDAVGMCDEAAMAWITAVTGVAISPPASADSTFTLHYDPAGAADSAGSSDGGGSGAGSVSAGAGQVDPLGQAVELLRLHSVVGPLCTRTRYLIFTLWRFAGEVADEDGGELGASATAAAQMTPNHPHLRIDPVSLDILPL